MLKGQTSIVGKYQNILCPFVNLYITQGSGYADGTFSHKGLRAIDVRGAKVGEREAYYAPVDCICIQTIPSYGEAIWQSKEKVRFADGTIDYVTFLTCHDNTFNAKVGLELKQGIQLGNMGNKPEDVCTGVHCHIEFAKGKASYVKNEYGNWGLTNAVEFEDACYMDDTNILKGYADWKYLTDIPADEDYEKLYNDALQTIEILQEQVNILEEENQLLQEKINKAIEDLK